MSSYNSVVLYAELKGLVAWSDWHSLRNRRGKATAPRLRKIAEKFGVSETLVSIRFWLLVGPFGRLTRIGEEPTVTADGSLEKGKYGSRRLFSEGSCV